MKIAMIGLGNMGSAIAPRLLAAGHLVSAWNRSRSAIDQLDGVHALASPAEAFQHEVVISLLANDQAVREVLIDTDALARCAAHTVHVVMSTLSIAMVKELQALHAQHGLTYVAAPVFGIPVVAAAGQLNILAAGPDAAIDAVQPLFDAIGRKTWRLGHDQVRANIAKISGNLMITQAIEAMAEASALTESHGLAAADFLEIVTQTMFACPSYQRYARNIGSASYEPGFKLWLGLKDVNLALAAASAADVSLPAAEVVRKSLERAQAAGLGERDWSALALAVRGDLPGA